MQTVKLFRDEFHRVQNWRRLNPEDQGRQQAVLTDNNTWIEWIYLGPHDNHANEEVFGILSDRRNFAYVHREGVWHTLKLDWK